MDVEVARGGEGHYHLDLNVRIRPVAEIVIGLQRMPMKEPMGTTRRGQLALGVLGLGVGVGGAAGLELVPSIFEPPLQFVLDGLGELLREPIRYDSSQRTLFVFLLVMLGLLWALLLARAFNRQPAIDRKIDAYLRRRDEIGDNSRERSSDGSS